MSSNATAAPGSATGFEEQGHVDGRGRRVEPDCFDARVLPVPAGLQLDRGRVPRHELVIGIQLDQRDRGANHRLGLRRRPHECLQPHGRLAAQRDGGRARLLGAVGLGLVGQHQMRRVTSGAPSDQGGIVRCGPPEDGRPEDAERSIPDRLEVAVRDESGGGGLASPIGDVIAVLQEHLAGATRLVRAEHDRSRRRDLVASEAHEGRAVHALERAVPVRLDVPGQVPTIAQVDGPDARRHRRLENRLETLRRRHTLARVPAARTPPGRRGPARPLRERGRPAGVGGSRRARRAIAPRSPRAAGQRPGRRSAAACGSRRSSGRRARARRGARRRRSGPSRRASVRAPPGRGR